MRPYSQYLLDPIMWMSGISARWRKRLSLKIWLKQETLLVNISSLHIVPANIAMVTLGKETDGELKEIKFIDLLEKPLGSVPSIIFWSDHQMELVNNISNMKHTLLIGDYGTGEL